MRDLSQLRQDALEIFHACIKAADPDRAVRNSLRLVGNELFFGENNHVSLHDFERITVLGAGKASASMAGALESLFADSIHEGLVAAKYGHGKRLKKVRVLEAGHPIPDLQSESASLQILALADSLTEKDLVISCISGGGSALLAAPAHGISLSDKQWVTESLIGAGADIYEINAVRKHLSTIKGGRLAECVYPATVINLMLSDVIGDDPGTIGSGPFAGDVTTFETAWSVMERFGLLKKAPRSVISHLKDGMKGLRPETPPPGDPIFAKVSNIVIGSNIASLMAGKARACELGYNAAVLSSTLRGDTTEAARFHAHIAEEVRASGNPLHSPACILSGGETTVSVRGTGLGGRNQHFVLSIVKAVSRIKGAVFLSAGSDGTDGPTDAAGAVADSETLRRTEFLELDLNEFLLNYDSYHFFEALGDLVITGPTFTNVMDIRLVLLA